MYKHTSSVKYANLFGGADLEYILSGSKLKENIIVNETASSYVYSFTLNLTGLYAVLNEDGSISLIGNNTDKVEFTIPAGYMFDDAGNYSEDVTYTLTSKPNGNYILTVTAGSEWINSNDRVFPVTVDPTITQTHYNLSTKGYSYNETAFSLVTTPSMIGETADYEWVVLTKINSLPALPASAYVYEASFKLSIEETNGDICIGAYSVVEDWANIIDIDSLNDAIDTDLISYASLEDNNSGLSILNITSIVREWYNGENNNGICLKGIGSAGSYIVFYNSPSVTEGIAPLISIKYTDMNGLEDYWTYSSYPISDIGSANINLATGKLSLSIGTLSTTDYLMPYMPTLTYNSTYAGEYNINGITTVPYKKALAGYGFKWSMNETVVEKEYYDENGTQITYYIFSDSDGTEHAFTEDEDLEKIVDEDGLGLELTDSTSNYTIKYPDKTVKTFTKKSDGTYFAAGGVLSSITDKNGNKIKFELNTFGGVSTIGVYPNGSSNVTSQLTVSYNNFKVNRILNDATNEAYVFYYSTSQTGGTVSTNGSEYLRKIIRVHYSGESSSPDWSDFMASGTTLGFVTDETYLLTYNNEYLKIISDVNADKQYDFTTTNQKTNIVCEKANLSSLTLGQKHTFTYGNGFTKVRTPGTDDIHGNGNDIMTAYTFDYAGRTKTAYSYTADKSEIYGGAGYVYENEEGTYSGIDRIKNNLKSSSVADGNDTNLLLNGGFDKNSIINSAGAVSWTFSNASTEHQKAKIPNNSTSGYIQQSVYLTAGAYTLSFETVTTNTENDFTCEMSAKSGNTNLKTEVFAVASEESIQSMTFDVISDSKVTIKIYVSGTDSTKFINVDNVMLVANSTSANYSLIQNGNFENIHYNSSGNRKDISSELWSISNPMSNNFVTYSSDNRMGRSLILAGGINRKSEATQTLYNELEAGTSGLTLKVSGYALGTDQTNTANSVFALRVDVHSTTQLDPDTYYVYFEPNIEGEWQFSSQILNLEVNSETFESAKIICEYSNHPGTAYFDNISVSVIPTESYSYNEYYDDIEEPEYGLLKKTVQGNRETCYEYDDNENVVKKIIKKGQFGEIYDYTYSGANISTENHYNYEILVYSDITSGQNSIFLPDEGIISTHVSKTKYFYNSYGQVTEIQYIQINETSQEDLPIKTLYQYKTTSGSKIFGALTQTTDTFGKTTKYFYDETKGILLAEVYPDNTGLAYEYDDKNRLVLTLPVTYNGSTITKITSQEKVEYSYNSKGYLSTIETEGTTYTFNYDIFGNSDTVGVGNRVLADYEYNSNNGKMKSLTYGNGDRVEYVYDLLDRVTEICYTESGGAKETLYEYFYTSEGYLKRFDNNVENTSTIYSYDGSGKLISTIECEQGSTNEYYFVTYLYDDINRPKIISTDITDETSNSKYKLTLNQDYDAQGRIEKIGFSGYSLPTNGNVSLVYDNINRLESKIVSFSGFNQTVTYTYEEGHKDTTTSTDDTTSTRVKTYQSTIGSDVKVYTYNYDDAGYITEVRRGNSIIYDYEYDDQGQITIFNDSETQKLHWYQYDKAGNITGHSVEDFSSGAVTNYTYTYGNSSWGDLLTAFNGNAITYDEIGNPLQYYNGNVFTWKQGRRLDTITNNGTLIGSYDYDENGIRTSKTTQWSEYKYILNGTQIVAEMWDDCINIYLYDENGSPVGFLHRYELMADNTYLAYFYEKNMFGDIVAIYDTNGVKQVSYTYDAFGNSTQTIHASGTRATENNLRYRGYYYDFETGLYYLNSRYYDPVTCRFINADGYISTGQGLIGYNMFAYCGNNPVMRFDPSGEWAFAIPFLVKVVEVAVVSLVTLTILSSDEVQDALSDIADDVSSIFESKTKNGEKVAEKAEESNLPIDEKIFYGADTRGKEWKLVTEAMTYQEAKAWVYMSSANGVYGKNSSWGLYTYEKDDALKMAWDLGGGKAPIFHQGEVGQFSHYHINDFMLFNKHKHFHLWYGGMEI